MYRPSSFIFAFVSICVGVILFRVKYEVVDLEIKYQNIKKNIQNTKESIHILKAEWAHLSNPERIQKLSMRYLPQGSMNELVLKKTVQKSKKIEKKPQENNADLKAQDGIDQVINNIDYTRKISFVQDEGK